MDMDKGEMATRKPPNFSCFNCGKEGHKQKDVQGNWTCPEPQRSKEDRPKRPFQMRSLTEAIDSGSVAEEEMKSIAAFMRSKGF